MNNAELRDRLQTWDSERRLFFNRFLQELKEAFGGNELALYEAISLLYSETSDVRLESVCLSLMEYVDQKEEEAKWLEHGQ